MNGLLAKHRPKDTSPEKWKEHWDNAGYTLEPLAALLRERLAELKRVKADDFDCPNHYAKLVYQGGKAEEIEFVLSLLPKSVQ